MTNSIMVLRIMHKSYTLQRMPREQMKRKRKRKRKKSSADREQELVANTGC